MASTTRTTSLESLPSPGDRPLASVVIFDGDCKFCFGQVSRLNRWDTHNVLSFISLHDPIVAKRWPDLTHDALMREMYLIAPSGNRFAGAAVFRWMSTRLPRLRWLAPLMHIPFSMPLWQFLYKQVAKRRYSMGKMNDCGDACSVHFR